MKGVYLNREVSRAGADTEFRTPPSQQVSPNDVRGQSKTLKSISMSPGTSHQLKHDNPSIARAISFPLRIMAISSPNTSMRVSIPWNSLHGEGTSGSCDGRTSRRSPSQGSGLSTCSSGDMVVEGNEDGSDSSMSPVVKQDFCHSSPCSALVCSKISKGKANIYVT